VSFTYFISFFLHYHYVYKCSFYYIIFFWFVIHTIILFLFFPISHCFFFNYTLNISAVCIFEDFAQFYKYSTLWIFFKNKKYILSKNKSKKYWIFVWRCHTNKNKIFWNLFWYISLCEHTHSFHILWCLEIYFTTDAHAVLLGESVFESVFESVVLKAVGKYAIISEGCFHFKRMLF
jgi:hypothetical protein